MKCFNETISNLPSYFWNMKTREHFSHFSFYASMYTFFECPPYKVTQNHKQNKKHFVGFRIPKIWQFLKHFAGTFCQGLTYFFPQEEWMASYFFSSFPKRTLVNNCTQYIHPAMSTRKSIVLNGFIQ